jgi:hypothetical protein
VYGERYTQKGKHFSSQLERTLAKIADVRTLNLPYNYYKLHAVRSVRISRL